MKPEITTFSVIIRGVLVGMVALLLAACETFTAPTVVPTRTMTGPTLAPTTNAIPAPPSEVPGNVTDTYGSSNPTAAALPNDLDLPPLIVSTPGADGGQMVQITLSTGETVNASLYTNVPVRAPGVLLLAEDRAVWGDFPAILETNGYTVLSVDLPPTVNETTFRDVMASFIDFAQADASRLDPGRIGVIGEQAGANFALIGCVGDLRCDAVALLSPTDRERLPTAVAVYNRPLLISGSRDDAFVFEVVELVAASAPGEVLTQPFNSAGRGAAILQNRPDMTDFMLEWLSRTIR